MHVRKEQGINAVSKLGDAHTYYILYTYAHTHTHKHILKMHTNKDAHIHIDLSPSSLTFTKLLLH